MNTAIKSEDKEMEQYEALAQAFLQMPLKVDGIYRTILKPNTLNTGHINKPTTRCGIVIGLRGQAMFTFNKSLHVPMSPGMTFIGGYNMQLEIAVADEGFEYFLLHYMPEDLEHEAAHILTEVNVLEKVADPILHQLIELAQQTATIPGMLGLLEKKTVFYRIVSLLLQNERQQQNEHSFPMMEEMVHYIQTHYMNPLTLEELASRCQLKPKYFSALFQKYTGIGPIEYVIQYRMEQAHQLLFSGQYTVTAVAKSVGYNDPFYFSRLFKKHRGLPPSHVMNNME